MPAPSTNTQHTQVFTYSTRLYCIELHCLLGKSRGATQLALFFVTLLVAMAKMDQKAMPSPMTENPMTER